MKTKIVVEDNKVTVTVDDGKPVVVGQTFTPPKDAEYKPVVFNTDEYDTSKTMVGEPLPQLKKPKVAKKKPDTPWRTRPALNPKPAVRETPQKPTATVPVKKAPKLKFGAPRGSDLPKLDVKKKQLGRPRKVKPEDELPPNENWPPKPIGVVEPIPVAKVRNAEHRGVVKMMDKQRAAFDDPWRCEMCRNAGDLCVLHESMQADGKSPTKYRADGA